MARRPTGLRIDDAAWPLLQAFVSYWGVTDSDGAAGGGTLVCSDLANQPDFDGNQVVIISGPYAGQARDINGSTTGGTVTVATAFGGQITSGTLFAIVALRTVPAEVADLAADVGDASGSTLGSLYGILGNPSASIADIVNTIKGLVDTTEVVGSYTYLDAGGEQDIYEDTATTRRRVWVCVSNRNMTQTGTFRIYRKVDGANYDLYIKQPVTVAAGDERAFDAEFTTSLPWKITYEEDADEGADRAIPYEVIIQEVE